MEGSNVRRFTDANFVREVLKSNKPVLVDFSTEWCPPCRRLAPIIKRLATEYSARVKVGKVDTDVNLGVAGRYGISSIPTILLFNRGSITRKFVGLRPEKELRDAMEAIIKPKT